MQKVFSKVVETSHKQTNREKCKAKIILESLLLHRQSGVWTWIKSEFCDFSCAFEVEEQLQWFLKILKTFFNVHNLKYVHIPQIMFEKFLQNKL